MNIDELTSSFVHIRKKRAELTKIANQLEKEEKRLGLEILAMIPMLGELRGEGVTFRKKTVPKPSVTDWDALYKHIASTQSFDLLHKRLTETAVKLRWDDGAEVPGVISLPTESLEVQFDE